MNMTTRSTGHRIPGPSIPARAAITSTLLGLLLLAACEPPSGDMGADGGAVITSDSSAAKADAAGAADASSAIEAPPKPAADGGGMQPPPPNVICTVGAQCASGFCVDGVCCNTACDGACESCALTGKVGTCSPIENATDDGCSGDSICDGAGTCRKLLGKRCAVSSECASGNCVDGVCCGSAACGTCQSCALPRSEGTCTVLPKFTDDADSDCSGEKTCDGLGACRSKNGTACGGNAECTSLQCADGVCCNEACTGTCFSCNRQGSAGICVPLDDVPDPSAGVACTGASICTAPAGAAPACKVKDGEPCTSNSDCLNGSCLTSYRDGDKDGYGQARVSRCELAPAAGYVLAGGDCCDSDPNTHPGVTVPSSAANACGGFDRNCDGKVERQDGSSTACGCVGQTVGKLGSAQVCTACI